MKKSLKLIALLLSMLLLLCSCGQTGETPLRSQGLDEKGYIAGVKALDYVSLCDISSIKVTETDIQKSIDEVLAAYPIQNQNYDKELADGDKANIAFVGKLDGVEFEGGSSESYEITVGETIFIDTFIDDCLGHKPGETFDIEETFPSYYPANTDLQDKTAVFTVTINYIIDETPGEYTDEYISANLKDAYGWNTREEMRAGLIQNLCYNYITENSTITEIPQAAIDVQKNSMRAYYQSYAEYYNMELEDFLTQNVGVSDIEEVLNYSESYIQQAATQAMYFQAISEKEGLEKITKTEIQDYFKETTGSSDFSNFKTLYGMPYLNMMTRNHKVFQLLSSRANVQ